MNNVNVRTYSISDFVQWDSKGELEISPKYQRNSVWNDDARSYLMDTILRGLPIPPIFLRIKIDVITKKSFKEIIDGQQRMRTILDYVENEGFKVKKNHNEEFGGMTFSELPEEKQRNILEYPVIVNIVSSENDGEIYDMFARLNSNNYVLNNQELRNAKYWGDFKVLVYQLSAEYKSFFMIRHIFSDKDFSRMKDAELINSMLIVLLEGVVTENSSYVDKIYSKYNEGADVLNIINDKQMKIMSIVQDIYDSFPSRVVFDNKNYFFSLYCFLAHQMFGIEGVESARNELFNAENIYSNTTYLINKIHNFLHDFEFTINDKDSDPSKKASFLEFDYHNRRRTTDKDGRLFRIEFLSKVLG